MEATLRVGRDTGGDTASGRLTWAFLAFASEDDQLLLLGGVTPQQYAEGQVTAHESWHQHEDGVCCPSDKADTVWQVGADGSLEAWAPHVTA